MLTTMEKILFLQRVPMFEGLSSRNLRVISDIAEEDQLPANQLVFEEGQPGDKMYILIDGQVQVEKQTGATPLILATLEKRDLLGDMALLDDEPRSASARTTTDTRLLGVGAASLRDLIREYPDIAFGLLKFCAQRIRETNRRLQAASAPATGAAATAGPRLTVLNGPDKDQVFNITTMRVKLGRAGGEEMEAIDRFGFRDAAKEVSRNHAAISRREGVFYLEDTGSMNGTFLNDQRLSAEAPLRPGDTIRLGSEARLRFDT